MCVASVMASLWGCPWMHLRPSGSSAPLLTCVLGCLQSGFCVLHRLWRDNLQSPKALGTLLGLLCPWLCSGSRRSLDCNSRARTIQTEARHISIGCNHAEPKISVLCPTKIWSWQNGLLPSTTNRRIFPATLWFTSRDSHSQLDPQPNSILAVSFLDEIPPLLGALLLDIPFLLDV